ncbi:hypothetical protein D6B99_09275 [Arachidicoccus soli]|uniref:Gylcosyl hydrolase 115 C-terminal domain-containing protein n=2 Tax=Arachidicoccus soli TaxID=2341117 RepID=A0A386HV06_9BACT|nr:hypothetical protein D6B99_09275 [Arachidicoccus soli]
MKMKLYWVGLLGLALGMSFPGSAQIRVENKVQKGENAFPLVAEKHISTIYYDQADAEVVAKVAHLFAKDISSVSGEEPTVTSSSNPTVKTVVIIGTLGENKLIDKLISSKKINVDSIRGGWEQFIIKVIKNPFPKVSQALVIVGSDRRGTAYGTFTISKAIGVSPWYWWADVPVKKQKNIYIPNIDYSSKEPSVKFRGIFINDEDWGMRPWASKNMDPNIKSIGPNTYARICELLLRLKANTLAPAMHPPTAFNKYPKNKLVADSFAIIMSSSHTEPLLFNNASEWSHKMNGDWNYVTNKDGILSVLDKRVRENSPYENIYTMGLRGIHDSPMADVPKGYSKVNVLESVIRDERGILEKYIKKPIDSIPQIFVPYKEVLNIYEQGMKLPDDITLVWPDDNFGYIKRLSDSKEEERSGGAGVYYHISYLGEPNDYLWINTTPPALIYEEMHKAYETGAKRYWLLNVGDLKPGELGIQFFMDMAWNINKINYDNIPDYESSFLASIFGEKYKNDLADIMHNYYRLGFERKPEYMGWDFDWKSMFSEEHIINTDFSFQNYNEAQNRLNEYDAISAQAKGIMEDLPKEYVPAFYELVYYPVKGADLMNKKMLVAQKNRWYARQGRSLTNQLSKDVTIYHDSIALITKHYNGLLNGKWNGIMTAPDQLPKPQTAPTEQINLPESAAMGIFVSGEDGINGFSSYHILPRFSIFTKGRYKIEVYNKGKQALSWSATTNSNWLQLSKTEGNTGTQDDIWVSVDWSKAPIGSDIKASIQITGANKTELVYVSLFNPKNAPVKEVKGMPVEDNGVVSIDPSKFNRKTEKQGVKVQVVKQLGYNGNSLQLGDVTDHAWNSSSTEYDFYTTDAGSVTVYTYALPVFARNKEHETRYGIKIDDSYTHWATTASDEYSFSWKSNVIRNAAINTTTFSIDKPGKHILKLIAGDPGMVIQKIVIDFGGMKRSYLGPEPTIGK